MREHMKAAPNELTVVVTDLRGFLVPLNEPPPSPFH
jgi:hypothetical protein